MKPNINKSLRALKAAEEAVSPVVATLLLVLVAAGAAIGFGVFLNGFQETTQSQVQSSDNAQVLRIGGSSTVYEFSVAAVPGFEAAHPGYKIDLQRGGSGAGKAAVCKGLIDIGSSSSPFDAKGKPGQDLETCPDFNGDGVRDIGQEMTVVKVANDGVVFATLPTNTHCATLIQLTSKQAYSLYYHNADNFGTRGAGAALPDAAADLDAVANGGNADGNVQWSEVPRVGGKCTGPEVVHIMDRSDQGGTSEVFTQKVLGFSSPKAQVEDLEITLNAAHQGDGNQGVLAAVNALAEKNDALFFSSFGYAGTQALTIHQFGKTAPVLPTVANIKSNAYDGSRPILYVTAGAPSPAEQLWLDWVTATENNIAFSNTADFISIYA